MTKIPRGWKKLRRGVKTKITDKFLIYGEWYEADGMNIVGKSLSAITGKQRIYIRKAK